MNFALLYGIFALNMCSMYLVEIARALEQKRTGGRNANEVELGGYTGKKPARRDAMELVDEEELKLNVESSSRKKSVWGPPPNQLNET